MPNRNLHSAIKKICQEEEDGDTQIPRRRRASRQERRRHFRWRSLPQWFKPGAPRRAKWLAFWLLAWNGTALLDALAFTVVPRQNLDGYLGEGTWCPATLAMVRMMANCQLGLVATVALVAWTGDERTLKLLFRMLIFITLGAFRGVYLGVAEGTIRPPWETRWAALLSLPPMLFLCYFAFVF